jgi:hypothetical protein
MHKTEGQLFRIYFGTPVLALLILACAIPGQLDAQPVLGAENTALGGGGTAYLTGLEATFWNPANLTISERPGQWHFGLGHAAILHEPILSTEIAGDQYYSFKDSYYPYRASAADISESQRQTILDNNYPSNELTSQHQSRADIILGGALWQRDNEAFSIVARARFASRIEVGRGWYSNSFVDSGNEQVRDFTIKQQRNHLYELSFGYSREFTFINGLFPQINKLHVGIAPKLVLAGPNINLSYDARYIQSSDASNEVFAEQFSYESTGTYSRATQAYRAGTAPQQAISTNFDRTLQLDHTGYGAGIDFGLTYLIPLGNDFSTIADNPQESIVSKSIRVALSINDVGLVRYNKDFLQLSSAADTTALSRQSTMDAMFIGADGQYLFYFDSAEALPNPLTQSQSTSQDAYTTLLPTSMNAGVVIQYTRLKLMADLTLGLNNTAFTTTKLAAHIGLEAYPIKQVPIRMGTRLAAGLPTRLGLGTGLEMEHWDFNIGTQVLIRSRTFTSEIIGGAFAGLQLHF